jgi:hypothetical protein
MTTDAIFQHVFSEFMQKQQTIAYLRVSTTDQDLEKNKFDILQSIPSPIMRRNGQEGESECRLKQ